MLNAVVANIVSTQVQQNEISHGKRCRYKLRPKFTKVIGSDLELLQLRDVAQMAQLNSARLRDFVHVELDVSDVVQVLRFDEGLESIVTNPVDS